MHTKLCLVGAAALLLLGAESARAEITHWAVPAMSGVKRLPDTPVTDGVKGGEVKIILAKDEYEPGSFVLESCEDLGKVVLELGEFRQVEGGRSEVRGERSEVKQRTNNSTVQPSTSNLQPPVVFPKENLDLKVVKVWYQNRNSWNNYFGDTGFTLCPELLLNDEDLIRVDTAKMANYARIKVRNEKGEVRSEERWLNPPRQINRNLYDDECGEVFACMRPEFADADTFQPVTLKAGERKQFFLTVHATKSTPAGVYRGEIKVVGQRSKVKGQTEDDKHHCLTCDLGPRTSSLTSTSTSTLSTIPVAIRVLDFTLPAPGCYEDETRPMNITFYTHDGIEAFERVNGGDYELAKKQYLATMKNRVAHGQTIQFFSWLHYDTTKVARELAKEAGMRTDVALGIAPYTDSGFSVEMDSGARRNFATATNAVGHANIFAVYGDETGPYLLRDERPFFHACRAAGFHLFLANTAKLFRICAADYADAWSSYADAPEESVVPAAWNALGRGAYVAWYANQHVGSENPEFNRRQNGLVPYLAGRSALSNYAHYNMPYDDDSTTYRPMCLTYAQGKGMIDTIAWEGFREGVDDIRYATKLKMLARKAAKSSDIAVRDEGVLALQTLIIFDKNAGDLAACRREMMRHILKMMEMGVGEK